MMTMCGECGEPRREREEAMREGVRMENATIGRGCIAIEVKEERVAPW